MKTYRLGQSIPGEPDGGRYSVSVSLDTIAAICRYEKGDRRVLDALENGYPRFYAALPSRLLDAALTDAYATGNGEVFAFPSIEAAARCADFIAAGRPIVTELSPALAVPGDRLARARSFRQHTGLIVSARAADAILARDVRAKKDPEGLAAKRDIRVSLAGLHGCDPADILLYPNGMAAMYGAYRAVTALRPAPTAQFGFCYVDAKEVQDKCGLGCAYVPDGRYDMLAAALATQKLGAVFCEAVSNPKGVTHDIERIHRLASDHGAFTVLDDTLVPPTNARVLPACDMVHTSLTKSFSGVGNVMGGAVILNRASPRYDGLKAHFDRTYQDLLYAGDAIVLRDNSRDFVTRMEIFNRNGRALAAYLAGHPKVPAVHHPSLDATGNFARIRRAGGGEGGLVAFDLKDMGATKRFYDAYRGPKGPSLGMNETIICPYPLLAHFRDRKFAAANGVRFNLVRSSCGLEPAAEIIAAHDWALSFA